MCAYPFAAQPKQIFGIVFFSEIVPETIGRDQYYIRLFLLSDAVCTVRDYFLCGILAKAIKSNCEQGKQQQAIFFHMYTMVSKIR
jgi:hypothetical protein